METLSAVRSLAALAQESRLAIFRRLVEAGPAGLAAGEIAAAVGISPTNLSFHLKELANAGLVRSRQEGRYVFYSAHFGHMNQLIAFLTDHCCERDGGCKPCAPDKPKATAKGTHS